MTKTRKIFYVVLAAVATGVLLGAAAEKQMPGDKKNPGTGFSSRKIVFIHHSVGGRWLAHEGGGLVSELNRRGFYVNDITYGWQPRWMENSALRKIRNKMYDLLKYNPGGAFRIGDRTDIGHFYEWFVGPESSKIMDAVYRENGETTVFGDHANSSSAAPLKNPGQDIENEVVIIKPCYPNSLYRGEGNEAATAGDNPPRNFAAGSEDHTIGNCKRIYNDMLGYFRQRPDKFFVVVSAPPRRELPNGGRAARAFSNWLVHDWLKENNYAGNNVMVFDFYNVLTSGPGYTANDLGRGDGNHHRLWNGSEQHVVQTNNNVLTYPREGNDNHPSPAGLKKATHEFVELFVHNYEKWNKTN